MHLPNLKKLRITSQQLGTLPTYRARFAKMGARTDACDRPHAEHQIREVYASAGYEPPTQILWVGSPWAAMETLARMQTEENLAHELTHIDGRVARYRLIDEVVDSVRDDVRRLVELEDWTTIYGGTSLASLDTVRRLLRRDFSRRLPLFAYGYQDSDWLGAYAFLAQECGFHPATALAPLAELASSCGWWVPLNGRAIACERPEEAHVKDGMLHNETGPALRFPDGHDVWAMDGMRVPKEIVTASRSDLPRLWAQEENTSIRQLIERRLGTSPLSIDAQATVLDRAMVEIGGLNHIYALVRTRHGRRTRVGLTMTNPSTGEGHTEWVSPEISSVQGALAWRNGTDESPRQIT